MTDRELFKKQMDIEIQNNSNKGNWNEWKPNKCDWLYEMNHHQHKLMVAIKDNNIEKIKEYSADVANIAEKAFTTFK